MNIDKTFLMIAKVKGKQTLGTSVRTTNREVLPFSVFYRDGVRVKTVEAETYLGSRIGRTIGAKEEISRIIGLGVAKIKDLATLWRGTGITRKRKVELVDSLIGNIILYGLETLNMNHRYNLHIGAAQARIYRRTLGLAPPICCTAERARIY